MIGAADAVLITWNLLNNDHMAVLHNNIEISPTNLFFCNRFFCAFVLILHMKIKFQDQIAAHPHICLCKGNV